MEDLKEKNHSYWLQRAEGYSEVNKEELNGVQKDTWPAFLKKQIDEVTGKDYADIKLLDMGCGPGFLSIVLARLGFSVTAADFAENMLKEAKENAGELAEKITFLKKDAENTGFDDESFDVIVTRNLTWNLPHPEKAYAEWKRILKKGGLLLVFDANWYGYLFDEEKRKGFDEDRKNSEDEGLGDYNVGENFDQMEAIARSLPLSNIKRPEWDRKVLEELCFEKVECLEDAGRFVYSEKEMVNYASTPMFMIKGVK